MMDFFTGTEIGVPDDVAKILQSDEQILLAAQQARSTSLVNPCSVFVTTHRIIIKKPTNLGLRKNVEDYRFVDIANVQLKKGIIRSAIILKMRFLSDNVEIDSFPNDVGDKIFKLVDDAISGRLSLTRPEKVVVRTPSALQQDIIDKIKKLAKLKDQGILSDVEFQTKKADLLSRL